MSEDSDLLTGFTFVQVTARQIWSSLPLVIAGGLVFAVACAPSVILAFLGSGPLAIVFGALIASPAWSALLVVLREIAEERFMTWRRLPGEIRRLWMRSVRLSLLYAVPLLVLWLIRPHFQEDNVDALAWATLYTVLIWLALAWAIGLYAYPFMVTHDLSATESLRNGAILSSRYVSNSVGMTGLAVLYLIATGIVGLPLLFFLPALYGMFVMNNFRLVMISEMET